jgi:hypothetical protein
MESEEDKNPSGHINFIESVCISSEIVDRCLL